MLGKTSGDNMGSMMVSLEPTGQSASLQRLYTQLTLCYPVSDPSLHSSIVDTLSNGLERLSQSFPWTAGEVLKDSSGDSTADTFKISLCAGVPGLIVKDLRDDISMFSMEALRKANFPSHMLQEDNIAPRKTLGDDSFPKPVFLSQATFVTGGLLLTFLGQHGSLDMIGQARLMELLSKACRGEEFSDKEKEDGNPDRLNIIPLLQDSDIQNSAPHRDENGSQPESRSRNTNETSASTSKLSPPPSSTWLYFSFSSSSLETLKSTATKSLTLPKGSFISTDDALSSFIWQSVTRARLPRLDSSSRTIFGRTVDARRYLNISPTYPGNLASKVYTTYHTAEELLAGPLGIIASKLRKAIDPTTSTVAYDLRASATAYFRHPDQKLDKSSATVMDLSTDIMLSSWAKVNSYDLDFGLGLGKPEAVRRPEFHPPREGLVYLMPKRPDGEIAVMICLRDEDLERLRADQKWNEYASYIG